MRNALVLSIALLLASTGPLFAAGEQEEEGPAGAAATAAEPEIVLVAGRYTWARNWLEVPTASQLGIDRFGEAPALAAMVQAGELPPVEERLPDDPLVIGPYREIGQYGGTLRVARMGPGDYGDMLRGAKGWLFRGDPSTNEIIPYLAKGYEVPADNTSLTIFLREGTKWSDGMPFTADDIMFLYTYGFADPEVKDSWGRGWRFNGELSTFAKVDDYTVRIDFPEPVAPPIWRSHLNWFRSRQEFLFTAAHHMKQYHKAFNPKVEELAKEEGFENWVALWNAAIEIQPRQRYTQPEMGPWIMESRDSSGKTLVRNPYFWAVDTAGNQLPYIDGMYAEYFSDPQVAILSMMQGSIDIGGRLMNPADFPLYKENENIGDYSVREWQDTKTARVTYAFNLNHEDPMKRQLFQDKRFRHALSVAINREELNEFAYQGFATPQQLTVDATAAFYDPSWARAYADFNPERAKQLLEELGLRDSDGDGFREGPDGEPFTVDMQVGRSSVLGTMGFSTSELVSDYWQEVGIRVNYKQISGELRNQLSRANQLDLDTRGGRKLHVEPHLRAAQLRLRLDRVRGALERVVESPALAGAGRHRRGAGARRRASGRMAALHPNGERLGQRADRRRVQPARRGTVGAARRADPGDRHGRQGAASHHHQQPARQCARHAAVRLGNDAVGKHHPRAVVHPPVRHRPPDGARARAVRASVTST